MFDEPSQVPNQQVTLESKPLQLEGGGGGLVANASSSQVAHVFESERASAVDETMRFMRQASQTVGEQVVCRRADKSIN